MHSIPKGKIRTTVIGICNCFSSNVFSMSDLMSINDQISQIDRDFKDSNSKLHGILMLVDIADDAELYDFIESYIGRLKIVHERLMTRGQKLETTAKPASNDADESDSLGR